MTFSQKIISRGLISVAVILLLALIVFFWTRERAEIDDSAYGPTTFDFTAGTFADLAGWADDNPAGAFSAFLLSCEKISVRDPEAPANSKEYLGPALADTTLGGTVSDWIPVCQAASDLAAPSRNNSAEIRAFFETHFQPVQILGRRLPLPDGPAKSLPANIEETGIFTGYYEPIYRASYAQSDEFSAKAYKRPSDLVDVDLGDFREELSGQRIAGRIQNNRLVPFPDHQEINDGALEPDGEVIAWMTPNDLFFLQIQGSGRLRFYGGNEMRIGYAGQNGHPYTAIGRVMVEQEIMPLEQVSMQSIRQWLSVAPEKDAKTMREHNASYVFFRELDSPDADLGPPGAQGVLLTPGRSLAVDLRYHMLGAPVWVDIEREDNPPLRRLMIAQDTGGAIRGPVRGDFFWGTGDQAGEQAGTMNARGKMYVLVPKSIAAKLNEPAQ